MLKINDFNISLKDLGEDGKCESKLFFLNLGRSRGGVKGGAKSLNVA